MTDSQLTWSMDCGYTGWFCGLETQHLGFWWQHRSGIAPDRSARTYTVQYKTEITLTTVCSSGHHCTNQWITSRPTHTFGPRKLWRIALTGLCFKIHMVSTQREWHSASCTILLYGPRLSTRAVRCFPTNPWITINVADPLKGKKRVVFQSDKHTEMKHERSGTVW